MGWRGLKAGVVAIALQVASPAAAGTLSTPGCLFGGRSVTVRAITPALEIVTASGETVLLAGLDPPRPAEGPPADGAARNALQAWLVGRTVMLDPLAAEPDRWGRTVGLVFAAPQGTDGAAGSATVSVTEAMLDAGLARAAPDTRLAACWSTLLAIERAARAERIGLWADPLNAIIAADDTPRLDRSTGAMAIVDGRILRNVKGRVRRYLGFSPGRDGFSVTVEPAAERRIGAALGDLAAWKGRRVRVRGFLDDRFGLQIDLTSPAQVEFIDP